VQRSKEPLYSITSSTRAPSVGRNANCTVKQTKQNFHDQHAAREAA
jgi:hypothetical protein